jgi:hypothetical protein
VYYISERNSHEKQDFIPVTYRLQGQPPDEQQSWDAPVATVTPPPVPNKQTQAHRLIFHTFFLALYGVNQKSSVLFFCPCVGSSKQESTFPPWISGTVKHKLGTV